MEKTLPFAWARRHGILLDGEHAPPQLICREGISLNALTEAQRALQQHLPLKTVSGVEFDRLLQNAYAQSSGNAMQAMENMPDQDYDLASIAQSLAEPQDLLDSDNDAPIIRLINALLSEAIKENASDIHIEPFENRLSVRLRLDGTLREILTPPRALAPLIASRVKVMARLDIAEKRLPQDGRIGLRLAGRAVDVRVSTIPCGHGERVVLRLLDKQAGRLNIDQLGLSHDSMQILKNLIQKPHGILFVTGPTGSGKTTTLYSALTQLNDRTRNIMTVEDPIEYYLDGIGQTQVNTKVEMSFARGLRAILRQDPDVVMIGEIRDLETAEIAVQASLTGHLVLSTLHTNSAVGAVSRLRDMGIEPFLLASSTIGLMAQRLVRLLCPDCKIPKAATQAECDLLEISPEKSPIIWHPKGCDKCRHSGYKGRAAIYEIIEINNQLRSLIHDNASEMNLEKAARQHTSSIRQDGFRRVLAGDTTLEEILRVTREN